ncbi:P-loop containing nucleoside triphosphate hydrolase protein [Cunninghamella echinulata]|nr:P-loop containing nucleoside triphosphate hydrolase protein [Cunninghamella echinulata]
MNLKYNLLRGIHDYGNHQPCSLYQRTIASIDKGHDILVQASSGFEKASTLCISALQLLDDTTKQPQVIILTSTYEMAYVLQNNMDIFSKYMNVKCYLCTNMRKSNDNTMQQQLHEQEYQIIVGTPGRIYERIKRRALKTDLIKLLILDEMDEMISCYQLDDIINSIFHCLPKDHQIIVFSATVPAALTDIMKNQWMRAHIHILKQQQLQSQLLQLEGVKQYYILIDKEEWKLETFFDLWNEITLPPRVIIFCNTSKKVDWLIEQLSQLHIRVITLNNTNNNLHNEHDNKINEFYTGSNCLLITTDTWVKHIDIKRIPLIINFDLPSSCEAYIRRIDGGHKCVIINFIINEDVQIIRNIERLYNIVMEDLPMDISNVI